MYKNILFIILLGVVFTPNLISCSSHQEENIQHYTCPMHPQIEMDSPGQCPICGMDLIPVKKKTHPSKDVHQNHKDQNKILINPQYTQNIGVITAEVKMRNLVHVISTYGKIAHDHKLWIAQNEYLESLKLKDSSLIEAAKQKLLFLGLSESWIKALRESESADLDLHLKTDSSQPKYIEAYVYQEDIKSIQEGLKTTITDQKGRHLSHGSIKAIGTLVDLNSRSIRVLIETTQALDLKLNTFVQVKIKVPLGEKLSIPNQAILFNGHHNMVYVDQGNGQYQPRTIQLGGEAENYYEIIKGLTEQEKVVVNGHFLIDSESQIKGQGMNHQH